MTIEKNSQYPVNKTYQEHKDRNNVYTAFDSWLIENGQGKYRMFSAGDMTSFALFFAERVKGSPIIMSSQMVDKTGEGGAI